MVDEVYLSEIINARLMQIINRLGKGLAKHGALKLPGGVIITGGSSLLQGIDALVADRLGVKTRIYQPDQMGMRNPIYTAAYGIVNYAYRMSDIDFLVDSAIYGNEVLGQFEEPVQESSKISKRPVTASETETKEAYNRHKLPRSERSPENRQKNDNQNKSKGIKNFFKKFFD